MSGEAEWDSPVSAYGGGLAGGLPRATPSSAAQRLSERQVQYSTPGSRPVSSMAALRHEALANVPPRTAPAASRAYRSTHNRDLSASTITLDDPVSLPPSAYTDRSFQTPASGRLSTAPTGGRESQAEHRRLMLEALGMFESQLSRLPPMGQTTTSTIPEVFQSSQQLVHTLDRLNSMIGASAGKALDAQIEAEIGDGADEHVDLKEIWQNVGCDQREHLRLSSEIVRNTTQLLLGVGKVLRDAVNANANAASHMRSVSLDEEAGRRFAASEQSASSDKRSSDGRQSRETRRSWDPRENLGSSALKERLANIGRSNASGSRPSSAMHSLTRGSAGSSEGTGDGGGGGEPQTSLSTRLASLALNPSTRRLYTPRDKRIVSDTSPRTAALMSSTTSQETVHAYEPSPTPATRQGFIQVMGERTRALPSLAIPSTLPTLPSESLITGQNSATNSYADNDGRRKVSTSSNMTVRAEGSSLPSMIKPPNATTAVTPTTVSNTPSSESPPSLSRTNSRSSTGTNGVTFSRPSTISISTLQQHANSHGHGFFHRAASMDSAPEGSNSPRDRRAGVDIERPKTIGSKGRASLDGVRANVTGSTTPSSTLQSIRKERRRTITEIFAQVNK
ncbi:hypothetical protein BDW22DRAFT_1353569 [Trametopsis cervina]|nr:hypothetical protein BDW22DRAFT_1353569 [Trametopsis cervina]